MFDLLSYGDHGLAPTDLVEVALALLLAFVLGQGLAWIYGWTHRGTSSSRPFIVSLLLMPVIVALVLQVLSNNLVTAFGLMAVFAIVRFRNVLRDTLDTVYVLAAVVIGMACGTEKFGTAIVGAAMVAAVMLYVWGTGFGARPRGNVMLALRWERPISETAELERVLHRHGDDVTCVEQQQGTREAGIDLSYRLWLRDPARLSELLAEMSQVVGVQQVSGVRMEEDVEV